MTLVEDVNKIKPDMIITYNGKYSAHYIGIIKEVKLNDYRIQWCSFNSSVIMTNKASFINDGIKDGFYIIYKMDMTIKQFESYNNLFVFF